MASLVDQLLERLRERFRRAGQRPVHDESPAPPTVTELTDAIASATMRDVDGIDALANLLLATARSGNMELVEIAERHLAAASPRLWLMLDMAARRSRWNANIWTVTAGQRLAFEEPKPLELVLAACHSDGHVREAAVARMGEARHAVFAPVLALRTADWVPQVRERARLACQHWLETVARDAVLGLGPVAFSIDQRHAGGWLADAVRALLIDGPDEVLLGGLAAPDRRTRRAAYQAGLEGERLDPDQLLRAALADADLPIRLACAEVVRRQARDTNDLDRIRSLLASGTAAIRADAVHTLGLLGDTASVETALRDRNRTVRATAQVAGRRAGTDVAGRYRALVVDQQPPDPSAIAGVGETGHVADADLLRPWLAHPGVRGRVEVVRALRHLDATPVGSLVAMLTDPAPAVVRQATMSLRRYAGALDEQLLSELLTPAHARHVRIAAYRLLRERDTWTRLAVSLRLTSDEDIGLRGRARGDIGTWLRHDSATAYTAATAAQRRRLLDLLAAAESELAPRVVRILRAHVNVGSDWSAP